MKCYSYNNCKGKVYVWFMSKEGKKYHYCFKHFKWQMENNLAYWVRGHVVERKR